MNASCLLPKAGGRTYNSAYGGNAIISVIARRPSAKPDSGYVVRKSRSASRMMQPHPGKASCNL
eukprot:scaffold315664_cov28-Tisochrysis_lutea.AAC.1